jgi:hypothetical protein
MSSITAACRLRIAQPLMQMLIGKGCPFQSGEIVSSSA